MTELLQQAITEVQKLPDEVQDAIAARLLAEIADEKDWAERFEATTDAEWDRLAENIRNDIDSDPPMPLDSTFPPTAR